MDAGIITKWIERYYEEKLDRRDKKGGPGASGRSRGARGLLRQLTELN
jgi:hypothetical protein